MTTTPIVRIGDDATRDEIEQAIRALRFKAKRMPAHWVERRAEVDGEVDRLVDMWLRVTS